MPQLHRRLMQARRPYRRRFRVPEHSLPRSSSGLSGSQPTVEPPVSRVPQEPYFSSTLPVSEAPVTSNTTVQLPPVPVFSSALPVSEPPVSHAATVELHSVPDFSSTLPASLPASKGAAGGDMDLPGLLAHASSVNSSSAASSGMHVGHQLRMSSLAHGTLLTAFRAMEELDSELSAFAFELGLKASGEWYTSYT